MATDGVDKERRFLLIGATSVVGAVGGAAALVPFVGSMNPSARALAAGAPVEIDVSKLEPGQKMNVEWRGKPVWVVYRTEQMLEDLAKNDPRLNDPESLNEGQQPAYAQNPTRSRKPAYSVLVGICTHLGCSPTYRPEIAPADLGANWVGGYYCPCHGSRFDLAGRVFQNVPANDNLVVPPYMFTSDTSILVGLDEGTA